jgi:site-specific recombinase XerD
MITKKIDLMIKEFAINENLKGFKSETVKRKVREIEILIQYLEEQSEDMTILSMTEEKLKDYLNTFIDRVSAKEYNRRLSNIRSFYKYLKDEEVILINPALTIDFIKVMDQLHLGLFTEDEVKRMLDVIPETLIGIRDRAIIELLYSTALRINELVNLDVEDIDLRHLEVTVRYGKNDKERVAPVGETAVKALHNYLDVRHEFIIGDYEDALFVSIQKRRINAESVRKRIHIYKDLAGIKSYGVSHALRHSCATHMLKNGAPLPVIRRLLGHSKLSTTEKYTHVMKDELKRIHMMSHPKADSRE